MSKHEQIWAMLIKMSQYEQNIFEQIWTKYEQPLYMSKFEQPLYA